jgi:hypothetical protein
MTTDEIALNLSKQEALVFFEWLTKVDSLGATAFQHPSEEKVLWKLQGQLESTLQEPFASNYKDIVAEARRNVQSGER